MKKLIAAICIASAMALTVQAKGKKHEAPAMTEEQKAVMADIIAKYDTNKDGKLDKDEKAKISAEDKAKMASVGLGGKKKK